MYHIYDIRILFYDIADMCKYIDSFNETRNMLGFTTMIGTN